MTNKKIAFTVGEFKKMLELAETNGTMLSALEHLKTVYWLLQTPEQIKNKETIREIVKKLQNIESFKPKNAKKP